MLAMQLRCSNGFWLLLSLLVFVLDYGTKRLASGALSLGNPEAFLPYFNFTLLHNYGAAFSFLSDEGGWQRWFFTVVAAAVSVVLVVWLFRLKSGKYREAAALSLILGGALGNLWDRIILGYVVDFIDWFYVASSNSCLPFFYSRTGLEYTCHWPAFNIADAAILLGAFLLVLDIFSTQKDVP